MCLEKLTILAIIFLMYNFDIFGYSNGNFPEGQLQISVLFGSEPYGPRGHRLSLSLLLSLRPTQPLHPLHPPVTAPRLTALLVQEVVLSAMLVSASILELFALSSLQVVEEPVPPHTHHTAGVFVQKAATRVHTLLIARAQI